VDALLEGSVLKSGERVRVDVRLVSTSDGRVLWASNPSERAIGDIFTIQDEIARNAAAGLQIQLSGEDKKRLAQRNTDNLEAYQAYLKGLYFANKRTPEGFEKSFAYFQQAIEKDRRYALAYAGLARTRALSVWFIQAPPDEAMAQTRAAAERALEIDDTLAEAHIAMSQVYWHWWDFANGLREDQRAIELDSGSAEAHHGYAYSLMLLGKPQEAITEMKRALDLDPLSVVMNVDVGEILLYARHYDEAIEALSKALEMDPHRPNVHHDLAEAYEQIGRHREAIAEYIQEDAVVGEQPKTLANFQEAFAVSGMRGFWQRKLESFKEREQRGYFPPFVIAEVYARLDDKDQAFAWLEKAYAERSPMLLNLLNSAPFDGLHSDPRFASLARRVGLSE
jgi:tetratricopeptide (TPR) repeat protein